MSWIEKELHRRAAHSGASRPRPAAVDTTAGEMDAASRVRALWQRIEAANQALPEPLRLRTEHPSAASFNGMAPAFSVWLRAPNGAGLALANDAIRYIWPGSSSSNSRSHNFWIRWVPDRGWCVRQRVGRGPTAPVMAEHAFDERRVDAMIKSLVTGARVRVAQVRRRRLWLF